MDDIIKTIFRQKKYEKVYRLSYRGAREYEIDVSKKEDNLLSDEKIAEYNICIPMLRIGEEIFLEDIEKCITIRRSVRGSDGSIIYYIDDEFIETENTKKTLAECEEKILTYNKLKDEIIKSKKELKELEEEYKCYKNEYRYKNRFFNFN